MKYTSLAPSIRHLLLCLILSLVGSLAWAASTVPVVVSHSPVNGATGVSVNAPIVTTFNVPMANPGQSNGFYWAFTVTYPGGSLQSAVNAVFSANATILTITPIAPWPAGTTLTVTFPVAVESAQLVHMAAPYQWSFTTAAASAIPTVVSCKPANNASGVSVKTPLVVTFSRPMNHTTVWNGLSCGPSISASATWSTDNKTLTLTPTLPLAYSTQYTWGVSTTATSATGVPLATSYTWKFTTAAAPSTVPAVVKVRPVNGATGVSVNAPIVTTFNVPMLSPQPGFYWAFTVTYPGGSVPLSAMNPVFSSNNTILTITPIAPWPAGTTLTVTFPVAVESAQLVHMANPYSWHFTTAAASAVPTVVSCKPANNASGVSVKTLIQVNFSQVMNESATWAAFSVSPTIWASPVWSNGGKTLTITPSPNLLYSTIYKLSFSTAAVSLAGVHLTASRLWQFTTAAAPAPRVVKFAPSDTSTGIWIGDTIWVSFNEVMEACETDDAFSVTSSAGTVQGNRSWSMDGKTLIFSPSAFLSYSTMYTVTIATTARSVVGAYLPLAKSWRFTTVAAAAAVVRAAVAQPVAGGAALTYVLSAPADVQVVILNLAGRAIAQLSPGPQAAGLQNLRWDGRNQAGSPAPAGAYLIRITARAKSGAAAQATTVVNLRR